MEQEKIKTLSRLIKMQKIAIIVQIIAIAVTLAYLLIKEL